MLPLLIYFLCNTNPVPSGTIYNLQSHRGEPGYIWKASKNITNAPENSVNYPIIAAALDWDQTKCITTQLQLNPQKMRWHLLPILSSEPGTNNLKFEIDYTEAWLPNWKAGCMETWLLQRLTFEQPDTAAQFARELDKNPANRGATAWYHWHELIADKRINEANALVEKEKLKTAVSFSYHIKGPEPQFTVDYPQWNRIDQFKWEATSQSWAVGLIEPTNNTTHYMLMRWHKPGQSYERSFKFGPSWQTLFTYSNGELTRSLVHCEANSYIEGHRTTGGWQETLVQLKNAPDQFVTKPFTTLIHFP